MAKLILILGGTRSGKSRYAVELAKQLNQKTIYLATMTCNDEEMKERIKKHRESRPESWQTVEEGLKCDQILLNLKGLCGVVVIDCLTNLVANLLEQFPELSGTANSGTQTGLPVPMDTGTQAGEKQVMNCIETMLKIISESDLTVLMVSNEVGSGIVPMTPLGRQFRDVAGLANQLAARYADEVYLLTAGIPVKLKG